MKQILGAIAFASSAALSSIAYAGACDDPGNIRLSAVVNIGAATTTKIVDSVSGKRIYVCNLAATLAGTTPTIQLKQGTNASTDCDTGAANLTGAMAPITGSFIAMGYGGDLFVTNPGAQFCGTTTGTGSSFQGVATYIAK